MATPGSPANGSGKTIILDTDLTARLSNEHLTRSLPPLTSEFSDKSTVIEPFESSQVEISTTSQRFVLPGRMENRQELIIVPLPESPDGVIGEGGQALVYAYVQSELGRAVAVKTLKPSKRSIESIESLVREACVTARLEHPNIVPVHYLHLPENEQDTPYWVMKRIQGLPLESHLPHNKSPWPFAKLLDVFRRVCDAVAFAHSRGIVHRDLKPGNVLVGPYGEVQVADWGLAVAVSEAATKGAHPPLSADREIDPEKNQKTNLNPRVAELNRRVRSGTIGALSRETAGGRAGTPVFMAPEQLDDTAVNIDARTDVFLLGGILYSILTGEPPHRLEDSKDLTKRHEDIRSCRTIVPADERRFQLKLNHGYDGLADETLQSLNKIVMRSLSRNQADRFESVEALVEALDRWEAESASNALCARAAARLAEAKANRRDTSKAYAEAIALANASLEQVPDNAEAALIRDNASNALRTVQRRSRRRLVTAAAAICLAFLVGMMGYYRTRAEWIRAETEKELADQARSEAESARDMAEMDKRFAEEARIAAEIARANEEEARRQKEAEYLRSEENAYRAMIRYATDLAKDMRYQEALENLLATSDRLRRLEWHLLHRHILFEQLYQRFLGNTHAISPDGKFMVSFSGSHRKIFVTDLSTGASFELATAGTWLPRDSWESGSPRFLDVANGRIAFMGMPVRNGENRYRSGIIGHIDQQSWISDAFIPSPQRPRVIAGMRYLALSKKGDLLAIVGEARNPDSWFEVHNLKDKRCQAEFGLDIKVDDLHSMEILATRNTLLLMNKDGEIFRRNISQSSSALVRIGSGNALDLSVSPDEKFIAVLLKGRPNIKVISTETWDVVAYMKTDNLDPMEGARVAFADDSEHLVVMCPKTPLSLFRMQNDRIVEIPHRGEKSASGIPVSLLAFNSKTGVATVSQRNGGQPGQDLMQPEQKWLYNPHYIIAASALGSAAFVTHENLEKIVIPHIAENEIIFSEVISYEDHPFDEPFISLWTRETALRRRPPPGIERPSAPLAHSYRTPELARIHKAMVGAALAELNEGEEHRAILTDLAVSPDGRYMGAVVAPHDHGGNGRLVLMDLAANEIESKPFAVIMSQGSEATPKYQVICGSGLSMAIDRNGRLVCVALGRAEPELERIRAINGDWQNALIAVNSPGNRFAICFLGDDTSVIHLVNLENSEESYVHRINQNIITMDSPMGIRGAPRETFARPPVRVRARALAIHPNDNRIAVSMSNGDTVIYGEVPHFELCRIRILRTPGISTQYRDTWRAIHQTLDFEYALTFSPDGNSLLCIRKNKEVIDGGLLYLKPAVDQRSLDAIADFWFNSEKSVYDFTSEIPIGNMEQEQMIGETQDERIADAAIKEEIDPKQVFNEQLHVAAREGDLDKLREMIEQGYNLNAIEPKKFASFEDTYLAASARANQLKAVQLLIEHGVDPNIPSGNGMTPILIAGSLGNWEIVKTLVENNADTTAKMFGNRTIITFAVDAENREMIEYLLGKGVKMDLFTAIYLDDMDSVKRLIAEDPIAMHPISPLRHPNKDYYSPLTWAIARGQNDIAKFMIDNSPHRLHDGLNMMWTVRYRNAEILRYLIEDGIDINIRAFGANRVTSLGWLLQDERYKNPEFKEIYDILLEYDAKP